MDWLQGRSDCGDLIKFSVREGYKARRLNATRKDALLKETIARQSVIYQKRDAKKRKDLGKEVKELLESGSSSSIDVESNNVVKNTVNDANWLVGKLILHTWEDDGQESQWYGRFIETFKKPSAKRHQTKVIIAYWDKDSIERIVF